MPFVSSTPARPVRAATAGAAVLLIVLGALLAWSSASRPAEATDFLVELEFLVLANEGDALDVTWTVQQVQDLIAGAGQVFEDSATGITFSWPAKPTLLRIDDPQKGPGGPGDVKAPLASPLVPYAREHLGEGEAAGVQGDDKTPLEAVVACYNAWANAGANRLPIVLMQDFVDLNGNTVGILGVAVTTGTNQPGFCVMMSGQSKANPITLAHELGHVLCLGHVDKTDNLMRPVKEPQNTGLNQDQVTQLCPKEMQEALVPQPSKIPTPTATPTSMPPPVGGVAEAPALAAAQRAAGDGSGNAAWLWAVVPGAGAALLLAGLAWRVRERARRV